MAEQGKSEAEAQGGEQPAAAAEDAKPAEKAERPARAEAKAPVKEPPPPGSIADLIKEALPDLQLEAYQSFSNVVVEISGDDVVRTMPVLKVENGSLFGERLRERLFAPRVPVDRVALVLEEVWASFVG